MAKPPILPYATALGAAAYLLLCVTNFMQFGPNTFVFGRLLTAAGIGLAASALLSPGGGHPLRLFPSGLLLSALGAAISAGSSFFFRFDLFTVGVTLLALSVYVVSAATRAYLATRDVQHLSRAGGAFMIMAGVQGLFVILNVLEGDALDIGPHALAGIAFGLTGQTLATEGPGLTRSESPTT